MIVLCVSGAGGLAAVRVAVCAAVWPAALGWVGVFSARRGSVGGVVAVCSWRVVLRPWWGRGAA